MTALGDARIATGMPRHPKTLKLVRKLGQAGAWNLVCLWLWAAANRSDGDLTGLSDEDLELAAEWDGAAGDFVAALIAIRFLEGEPGSYRVHDWAEHQPWAAGAAMRSAKARWNAAKRHHGIEGADRLVPEYAKMRPRAGVEGRADGGAAAVDDGERGTAASTGNHASSTPNAAASNAASRNPDSPSPFPSPFPSRTKKTAARASKPRTSFPDNFAPNDAGIKAATEAGIELGPELAQFSNHHLAKGSVMADWQAAWRTWVGMAVQFGRGGRKLLPLAAQGWFRAAGFDNEHEARNAGCYAHNAAEFANGERRQGALA